MYVGQITFGQRKLFFRAVSATFAPDCLDYNLKSKKHTRRSHLGKLKDRIQHCAASDGKPRLALLK